MRLAVPGFGGKDRNAVSVRFHDSLDCEQLRGATAVFDVLLQVIPESLC
jgi:hypothetical protein